MLATKQHITFQFNFLIDRWQRDWHRVRDVGTMVGKLWVRISAASGTCYEVKYTSRDVHIISWAYLVFGKI